MKYRVNWDNGLNACGTFPQVFDTYEAAEAFGEDWANESNARDGIPDDDEGYSYDVIEEEDEPEEYEEDEMALLRKAGLSRGQP